MTMFRFTIRDLLWLMTLAGVTVAWLLDRNAIRHDRAALSKREAELTSRAKMWEAEANRAEKRCSGIAERLQGIMWALQMRDMRLDELIDANNKPKHPQPFKKTLPADNNSNNRVS